MGLVGGGPVPGVLVKRKNFGLDESVIAAGVQVKRKSSGFDETAAASWLSAKVFG